MKKNKRKQLPISKLDELRNGELTGGFTTFSISGLAIVYGGQTTNNCLGGNCVAGCGKGQNTVYTCGGNVLPNCGSN
jgi:hypothetical protein